MAVQVQRVVAHGELAHPDAHPVALAHVEAVDAREHPAVPGPEVEIEHGADLGCHRAGLDVVGRHQKAEVTIDLGNVRVALAWVGDPQAHQAHGHLHHRECGLQGRVVEQGQALGCVGVQGL